MQIVTLCNHTPGRVEVRTQAATWERVGAPCWAYLPLDSDWKYRAQEVGLLVYEPAAKIQDCGGNGVG